MSPRWALRGTLDGYWEHKPDQDRDWDSMLITQFIDSLIELRQTQDDADRSAA